MDVLVAAILTLIAYLAGLLSFKVKTQWCAACGAVKSCPNCAAWTATVGTSSSKPPRLSGGETRSDVAGMGRGRRVAP